VEQQREIRSSMLSLYQRLIALRRAEPALCVGSYTPVASDPNLIAYVRQADDRRFLVVLNLGPRPAHLTLDGVGNGKIEIATDVGRVGHAVTGRLVMRGDDALVVRLDSSPARGSRSD